MQTHLSEQVSPNTSHAVRSDLTPSLEMGVGMGEYVLTFKRGPNIQVRVEITSSDPLRDPLTQVDFQKTIDHLTLDMKEYPTKTSLEQGTDSYQREHEAPR